MTDPKFPDAELMELDVSFLTPLAPPTPRVAAAAPVAEVPAAVAPVAVAAPVAPAAGVEVTFPLIPLADDAIPATFKKAADPTAPAPGRMMAARAMAPIPPRALIPILYQLLMDPDAKIAAAAAKTFNSLDDKLVSPVLSENLPAQVLEALAHVLADRFTLIEKVLLNKATPDSAFAWLAEHAGDAKVITIIIENQERLLRTWDIARSLSKNPKALRSDLDKAIDFLVREGVYLDDISEFEDAFLRLGKAEMLGVLKNIKVKEEHLSERERQRAAELGMSADEFMSSGSDVLSDEEREALLAELEDEDGSGEEVDILKTPFMKLPIPIQIKLAMTGPHEKAIEGLQSSNRVVAGSAIRNPKIKENDIVKISRSKTMHEEVIRYICNNGDWTKSYSVKFNLVQNPKTPPSLVSRWMPLIRASDLKQLSKSKQVPTAVAIMAKRMMNARDG